MNQNQNSNAGSNRRDFLKTVGMIGAGLAAASAMPAAAETESAGGTRWAGARYMGGFAAPKLEKVRWGAIGVGARGSGHVEQLSQIEGSEIVAISDLYPDWGKRAADGVEKRTAKRPELYVGSPTEYHKMLARPDIDAVVIATPWEEHAPMVIAAMKAGKHAFVEVPLAFTMKDLWDVVNTSEQTGKHCMMLENCNYSRDELMFLNICRQGLLGQLLHGEAAYLHPLCEQMHEVERGTGSWRTKYYALKNGGNLYPTHGLGPVAQYMNLVRTEDNFDRLVSFASPAFGRQEYAKANFPPDHQWNQMKFEGGDLSTQIIKTQLGRTIMVQWDETTPRPYSRHNLIMGTKGVLAGYPNRAAVKGLTNDNEEWAEGETYAKLYEQYDHPLWKRMGALAVKMGGHGGMDFIMRSRMVECLRAGAPLDQNVYEGAMWSSVRPLSSKSEAEGGAPQKFVDFTRGNWKTTASLGIIA
jgi:predicted dehydrogenase